MNFPIKMSHIELSTCLKQPRTWLLNRANAKTHGYSFGYEKSLLLSIWKFHKTGSEDQSRDHLQQLIKRHSFKSAHRIGQIEDSLDLYIKWAKMNNLIVFDVQARIHLNASKFLILVGEVHRVDIVPQGYRGILLQDAPENWKNELRMPLIQRALAEHYDRPCEEIVVGYQCRNGSGLSTISYSETRINSAGRNIKNLSKKLYQLDQKKTP